MTLPELIDSVDILGYISQYVEFEEKNGEHWGLSPLKDEVTPSFSVRAETQKFHDFASGKGGNILSFIRAYHSCDVGQAANILRAYCGDKGVVAPSRKMEATLVAKKFAPRKRTTKISTATILPDSYMERFRWAEDKLVVWEDEGISADTLRYFGVSYDDFSNRIVYPIRNLDGKIINVSGRTVDPDWKELKLRKYTYFKSFGTLDLIYGLYENIQAIKEKNEVIIFEGAKSVMLSHSRGVLNTAAILTSHLNQNQLKILIKLGYRVVFALDKGVDIKQDENIKRLKQFVKVEYICDASNYLEDKMSPVDRGQEVWNGLYERRMPYR